VINLLETGNRNSDLQYTDSKFAVVLDYPRAGLVCGYSIRFYNKYLKYQSNGYWSIKEVLHQAVIQTRIPFTNVIRVIEKINFHRKLQFVCVSACFYDVQFPTGFMFLHQSYQNNFRWQLHSVMLQHSLYSAHKECFPLGTPFLQWCLWVSS